MGHYTTAKAEQKDADVPKGSVVAPPSLTQ
jgi:hypothetical protein